MLRRRGIGIAAAVVFIGGSQLWAGSSHLRLPTKYVESTWTVHTFTGLTSDYKEKEKLLHTKLDIAKLRRADGDTVMFTMHPRPFGNDKTEKRTFEMSIAETEKLLEAFTQVSASARQASRDGFEGAKELYKSDATILVVVTKSGGRVWRAIWTLDQQIYQLSPNHVRKVVSALKRL